MIRATSTSSGTSIAASAAKASNETLYRWYGDKRGLFETMARDNAAAIRTTLNDAIAMQDNPTEALKRFSPAFLAMILCERAISLNRAATADPTGELGKAISAGGREEIMPLIRQLIAATLGRNAPDVDQMTKAFIGLLLGDLQIKRVVGVMPPPTNAEIEERCDSALDLFSRLIAARPLSLSN